MSEQINYRKKTLEFLSSHTVAILSTIDSDGTPDGSVIYVYHDDNFNFFFITKSQTAKSKNLEKNQHAALTIVDPELLITVQAKGKVNNVELDDNYPALFLKTGEIMNKSGKLPPVAQLNNAGEYILYRFEPTWLRFGDFSEQSGTNEKKHIFYQLIPADGT